MPKTYCRVFVIGQDHLILRLHRKLTENAAEPSTSTWVRTFLPSTFLSLRFLRLRLLLVIDVLFALGRCGVVFEFAGNGVAQRYGGLLGLVRILLLRINSN